MLADVAKAARPTAGAAVMATGIVAAALDSAGARTLAKALTWVALAFWIALTLALALRIAVDRERLRADAATPAALTGVAATATLGTRADAFGDPALASVALALATAAWVVLVPLVLRAWAPPTTGSGFLLAVATESLAVLAATVSGRPLVWAAVAAGCAGLAAYALALASFDLRQLVRGAGDHWVAGGALAIATLAASGVAARLHGAATTAAVVLWALAALWLLPLIAAELARPRLAYDVRRWATVFPLGMYAEMSTRTGRVAHAPAIAHFGHVMAWVALVAWAAVGAGGCVHHFRAGAATSRVHAA